MGCATSTAGDRLAAEARVKELIAENKVIVFSKSYCPYCIKAKSALKQFTSDYAVLELDNHLCCNKEGKAIQGVLKTMTGASTVPRVFINGKCIGGGDETAAAAKDGSLEKMLSA